MRAHLASSLSIAALSLMLVGCEVGPDYQKPDAALPDSFKSADPTMPNAAPNEANDPQAAVELTWWNNFNDPVLSQLIDKAITGNFDLKIAMARIAQARAARSSADAALLPTGDLKGSVTREANQFPVPISFPGITKPFDIYETGFDASWELDLFGGNKRSIEAASAELQASEASYADARISLLAEVARTYVDIRQYQMQLKLTNAIIASDQHTVDITKQQVAAGTAPGVDVTRAESQVDQAKSQLATYGSEVAQNEYALDLLLGEQPGTVHGIIGDGGNIPWTSKQLVLSAPAVVIDNRPDIHMAERKLASATAQQGVATAQFYPDISLNGFLGLLNTHSSDLLKSASKSWIMGASVAWPILSYGKLEANQEGADAAQQEALATYQKSIIAALVDVEKSVTTYTQQEKFRTALASSVEKNHQATKVSEQRYSQGVTPFLDVLDAQRTYYSSELQLAQARADTARNLIAVYKSLGGGWTPRGTSDPQPASK